MKDVAIQLLETAHSSGIKLRKNVTFIGELVHLSRAHHSGRQYAFFESGIYPTQPGSYRDNPLYLDAYEFAVNWPLSAVIGSYKGMIAARPIIQEQEDGFAYSVLGKTASGFASLEDARLEAEMGAMDAADDYLLAELRRYGAEMERADVIACIVTGGKSMVQA